MYQKKCIYIYATLHEHSTGKSSTGNTYISTSLLLLISLSFSFSSSSFGNGRKCLCWYFNWYIMLSAAFRSGFKSHNKHVERTELPFKTSFIIVHICFDSSGEFNSTTFSPESEANIIAGSCKAVCKAVSTAPLFPLSWKRNDWSTVVPVCIYIYQMKNVSIISLAGLS